MNPARLPRTKLLTNVLGPAEKTFLLRLILYAFAVRALLALFLDFTGYSRLLAPDELTYVQDGWVIALYWVGDILTPSWRYSTGQPVGYFEVNALFFALFGQTEIPVKLLNAFLGAYTCRYAYLCSRSIFGIGVARRTARFCAFLPSLILWSALNIRDVWVILILVFLAWKGIELHSGRTIAFFQFVAALLLLSRFRDYLFYVVILPPLVAYVIGRRGDIGRSFLLAMALSVAAVVLLQRGVVGDNAQKSMSLEAISQFRQGEASGGGSGFALEADISTPTKALAFLPVGIAYFLFSPFPWQITSVLKALSAPEMLLIYYLTPSILRGIRYAIRERFRESLQILLLTVLLTVSYALGSGNVGTLYRHRAQAIVFYMMFAAVGLELRQHPAGLELPNDRLRPK